MVCHMQGWLFSLAHFESPLNELTLKKKKNCALNNPYTLSDILMIIFLVGILSSEDGVLYADMVALPCFLIE